MTHTPFTVLVLCTGNSARSIFAETLLRDLGKGKFQAFSAGTRPNTELNPFALEVLRRNGHDVTGLRSKHIAEFQTPDAPEMQFVFTVCDTAASEDCPPWPGQTTGSIPCKNRQWPPPTRTWPCRWTAPQ